MSATSISAKLRNKILNRDKFHCVYCRSQQSLLGSSLTLDHIIPQSLGGSSTEKNLCAACYDCNFIKANRIHALDPATELRASLFDTTRQHWPDHFQWNADKTLIEGLTPTGRATVKALKLNRPKLVIARRFWLKTGIHPPDD